MTDTQPSPDELVEDLPVKKAVSKEEKTVFLSFGLFCIATGLPALAGYPVFFSNAWLAMGESLAIISYGLLPETIGPILGVLMGPIMFLYTRILSAALICEDTGELISAKEAAEREYPEELVE